MFENLTKREKILALSVSALVPISLAFMGVFWFINAYSDNGMQVISLSRRVGEEQDKMTAATKANQRRIYYRSISLPSDTGDASNDYQIWLKNLVRDKIKMEFKSVTPRDGGEIKFQNKRIGRTKTYTLLATSTLPQLTEFLYDFYSVDLLHRINSIKVIPLSTGSSNDKKRVRSGKLSLIINVEFVSLMDADSKDEFEVAFRDLQRSREQYEDMILRRNVFGPANNTPTVAVRPSSSYTSEKDIRVSVTGKDADENDLLSFELLESGVEGAKLVQTDEKSRRATLEVPGQAAGKYEFKIGVRDSGFPSKMNETVFSVTFKDRVVSKPPTPPPPKPKYVFAQETLITGIVKDRTDNWLVWIKVRPTGARYKLKVGESFELDEKEWTVQSIQPNQATLQVENRLLTYRPTDRFSNPREEKVLSTPSADQESKTKVEVPADVSESTTTTDNNSGESGDSTQS